MLNPKEINSVYRKLLYNPEYHKKYNREIRRGLTEIEQAEKEYEQIKLDVHRANMRVVV